MSDTGQAPPHTPRRVTFDPTVNLGHLLTMTTMLAGGVAVGMQLMSMLGTLDTRVGMVEKQIGTISRLMESSIRADTQIEELKRRLSDIEQRER